MYQAHSWWFPDQDTHFSLMIQKHLKKGGNNSYQELARHRSISYCQNKSVALDIGANVGLWTKDLCQHFSKVIAFEPVEDFRQCLMRNVPQHNLEIMPMALGDVNTNINMIITPDNTGHSHVDMQTLGQGSIPMHTLDSLNLTVVDYIKIDCEGFENKILAGAKETILRCRPIMVVEDKKHKDVGHADTRHAIDTLLGWGAKILETVRNDQILGWP